VRSSRLGLIEYLLIIGIVLGVAVFELISLTRSQRRERRIRKGNSERTQGERNLSRDRDS
jgi:hypothetical protein